MFYSGTHAENCVPPKPMCRQVLTAGTCRALLSCLSPSAIFSSLAVVGCAHCPCKSGCIPTCRSGDRRVSDNSMSDLSRGHRLSVVAAFCHWDSCTTQGYQIGDARCRRIDRQTRDSQTLERSWPRSRVAMVGRRAERLRNAPGPSVTLQ